ncbi:MAG: ATP-binding protein, partial [Bacillota bacterium]
RFQYKPKRGFEYISSAVTNITGYTPAEFYADPILEMKIVHPDDLISLAEFRNKPAQMDKPAVFRLIHKNGALIWTEQRGVPIYEDGTVIAFEGIIRDITPRKRMEQDMAKLEGLNAIGQMAANIAHEIRNPMTTVRGYLQLLGGKSEFNAYKDEFELLLSELDRTNAIITEYLALSKEKTVDFTTGQLNDVINAMLPLMQADANANTKSIETNMRALPEIQLNDKEIRQLILNLVRNGLEAMDSGGMLTIETGVNDKGVVLAVRDQGKGIPEEILSKLGTPFFTTKKDGTGLGLAVCYRIASRHGAMIEYETSPQGTDFYIYFPMPDTGAKN